MTRAKWPEGTDDLLGEILTDAFGDDEQLWAFRQAFEDHVPMAADAFVVGEPVEVLEIDYDGNVRRGLTARCRREDGSEHVVAAAELSLGKGFDGVLPWGRIDNRPFLRCMHGYGLCLWRLGRLDEAAAIFERMLWLNPSDNQGVRFILPEVRSGRRWEDQHGGR